MMPLKDDITDLNTSNYISELNITDGMKSNDNLCIDFDLKSSKNSILNIHNDTLDHNQKRKSKFKWLTKTKSLYSMMFLSTIVFLLELIIGNVTHSNSLVADSFHMLSDLISFLIALIAIKFSKKQSTTKNTYGWARSEVLGSLINAVFLLALCFSIIVEAINRLFEPHPLRRIELIITVGLVGLIINIIGLILFSLLGGHHFHSHGPNHNHSHHQHNHNHQDPTEVKYSNLNDKFASINDVNAQFKFSKLQLQNQHCHDHENESNMNIRGVFLHVMADALGSIAVVVSAILVKYVPPADANWKIYIDPILSLVLTIFIIASVIPLLKESSHILLQSIPYGSNIYEIKTNILKINGVLDVHNFHLWSLNSESYVATMHVKISKELDFLNRDIIIRKIKSLLHLNNIHTTTLQLEVESADFEYACCSKDTCLKSNKESSSLLTKITNINSTQINNNETSNNHNDSSLLGNDSVILEGHNQFL